MGVITTYVCDKCGRAWNSLDKDNQPVAIAIFIQFGRTQYVLADTPDQRAMWCRECVMKFGVSEPCCEKDKEVAPKVPLSFEEKFVMLLNDLGFERER